MKRLLPVLLLLLLVAVNGCTTKAKARLQSHEAFVAGQQQALAQMHQPQSVMFIGDVQNRAVPFSENLTLASAIVAADYRGRRDPRSFVLKRNGQIFQISARQLLQGEDFPLQPGDAIEIVP